MKCNHSLQIKLSYVTHELNGNDQINSVVESITTLIGKWMHNFLFGIILMGLYGNFDNSKMYLK